MNVLKRDGRLEALDISKVDKVLEWAAEDFNVSASRAKLRIVTLHSRPKSAILPRTSSAGKDSANRVSGSCLT